MGCTYIMGDSSCDSTCSAQLEPDASCLWSSPLTFRQRLNSAGNVITGSCYCQAVLWSVTKEYHTRVGLRMGMEVCPWLQKFHEYETVCTLSTMCVVVVIYVKPQ